MQKLFTGYLLYSLDFKIEVYIYIYIYRNNHIYTVDTQ
jgi:hypothetical protein